MCRQAAVSAVFCRFAVHPAIVSGFHSFKIEEDIHTTPSDRHGEFGHVGTHRVIIGWYMGRIGRERISYIGIDRYLKSLQFPVAGYLYVFPAFGAISRFVEICRAGFIVFGMQELPGSVP